MTILFTKDHEYLLVEGDVATVGISDHAQGQLGDVVYVELPAVGRTLRKGEEAAVVESVKAASEVFAPASGAVIAINDDLEGTPALVNEDPVAKGWFMKVRLSAPEELDELMTEEAYGEYLRSLG